MRSGERVGERGQTLKHSPRVKTAHRIFWPYVVSALFFALCSGVFVDGMQFPSEPDATLRVAFGATLLVAAAARAHLGSRLPEVVSLTVCLIPFAAGLVLGERVPPTLTGTGDAGLEITEVVSWQAMGAKFSLGLVAAELVTWCRFPTGARRHGLFTGLMLALPFLAWWVARTFVSAEQFVVSGVHATFCEALQEQRSFVVEPLFGVLALVLVSLAVVRGARTVSVLTGLSVASVLLTFIKDAELAWYGFGASGTHCSPLTRFEVFELDELMIFGSETFEALFWVPGFISVVVGVVMLRQRPTLALVAVAVAVTGTHLATTAHLARFVDVPNAKAQRDFIPRGQGRQVNVLRISANSLLDVDGSVLLSAPLGSPEALGRVLASHTSSRRPTVVCGSGNDERFDLVELALDARLSPSQELAIARAARDAGVVALEIFEGEDRGEPRSPTLLSTQIRRALADVNTRVFLLNTVSTGCDIEGTRSTMDLTGLRWRFGAWNLSLER